MSALALTGRLPQSRPFISEFVKDLLVGIMWAITHPTNIRNAMADVVVDALDAGAGAGALIFQDSGSSTLATLPLSDPAAGNAVNGIATFNAITDETSASAGTSDRFICQDSDSNLVLSGAVAASGSDINMSNPTFSANDTVGMSSLTYESAA